MVSNGRPRVIYAWELGDNFGHLRRGLALAMALRQRGYPVLFVVRNTSIADRVLGPEQFRFLQSPVHMRRGGVNMNFRSYTDIFLASGYDDSVGLSGILQA